MSSIRYFLQFLSSHLKFFTLLCLTIVLFGCSDDDEEHTAPAPPVVYMWHLGMSPTDGNIGGVEQAHRICANNASMLFANNSSVTHHSALLASSSNDPRKYFSNDPEVQRPNGTVMANAYSEFFDNTIPLSNALSSGATTALWTGLGNNGKVHENTCRDWTSNSSSDHGRSANPQGTDITRISNANTACNTEIEILCLAY